MSIITARMYPSRHASHAREQGRFLNYWKEELEQMSSDQILHWAIDSYYPRLALVTSFEPEGCVLLSMLAKVVPNITVLCNELDARMQHYWGIARQFYVKSGLEIEIAPLPQPIGVFENTASRFDAILCGMRRQKRSAAMVLESHYHWRIPVVSPLVRWNREAVMSKMKRDDILAASFLKIWDVENDR